MNTDTLEQAFIFNANASLTTLQDAYQERFEKLSALVHLSLCDEFSDYPKKTTYHYHAVISDMIDELRDLQQAIRQKTNKEETLAKLAI